MTEKGAELERMKSEMKRLKDENDSKRNVIHYSIDEHYATLIDLLFVLHLYAFLVHGQN